MFSSRHSSSNLIALFHSVLSSCVSLCATKTDLLRSANRQSVVVICLLRVMVRAHFVDIESNVLPLLVTQCPAQGQEQEQKQVAVQAYHPLVTSR